MKGRIKKIFENADADAIIIMNGSSVDMTFFYVTGFESGLFENSAAVLYPDGSMAVICPELEEGAAGGKAEVFSNNKEKFELLKDKVSGERVGINSRAISHADFMKLKELLPEARFIDVGDAIRRARVVKDGEEIKRIKKAGEIASHVSNEIVPYLHEGVKESDILAEINYIMAKKGAMPSFDTIVAFGVNSSIPHYSTGEKEFEFPALMDFGARYGRYCSDMTRTFVSGREQSRVYEIVREGQEIAFDMMKEGVKATVIQNEVDEFFSKHGFGKMIHSLGHSLGLEVHDGFSMKDNFILKEGMVITVEPGIYLKDRWGIRIEDDVLVKRNGIEILTKK